MESVLTSFTQRAPWTLTLWKEKVSPGAGVSGLAWGASHRWARGWAGPHPTALLHGRSRFTFLSVTCRSDPLVSFPQILLRGAHVQLLDLCFGNPCPKLLTDCSSPCCQGWGTESSLCFEEVEIKYTFIFYCDLFRTTFYKMPCFIYYCFWKVLIKLF